MRVLTANLFSGRASEPAFRALLDDIEPDVIICEEVGVSMAAHLAERYEHGFAFGDDLAYRGHAMLGRIAIDVEPLPLRFRTGLVGRVSLGADEITLIGAHLANPVTGPSSIRFRRDQVADILAFTDRVDGPLIVAGDLNATPVWPAYRTLTAHLDDLVRLHLGSSPRTWSVRPGWRPMLAIDHILGRGVAATAVQIHAVEGSDHLAVVADIEVVS